MLDTDGSRTTVQYRPSVRGRETGYDGGCPAGGTPQAELVTVPTRQGLETVDILRLGHGVGPVLHDYAGATLGFLVPPGTAARWELPGSACAPLCGAPSQERSGMPPIAGAGWLIDPDAATLPVTDATRLRTALGQARRTLEAADRCA